MTHESITGTEIHDTVSQRYGEIAESGGASCCGGGATDVGVLEHAAAIGYDADELAALPDGANLGLGCGSPTSLTLIEEGHTVVDLGSGAGIDCFLASKRVGETGRVIGVDMTDAMLEKARAYAAQNGFTNVQFRKGFIEALPVEDSSVDLVISNCVINLSPDKSKVFGEIARVLKPGGRAAISDIVLLKPLPDAILKDVEAYIGCVAGASMIGDYVGAAMTAGLDIGKSQKKAYDVLAVLGCSPEAGKLLEQVPADFNGNEHIASLDLLAVKPGVTLGVSSESQPAAGNCAPGSGCC